MILYPLNSFGENAYKEVLISSKIGILQFNLPSLIQLYLFNLYQFTFICSDLCAVSEYMIMLIYLLS